MHRFLVSLLLVLGVALSGVSSAAESAWWQAGWSFRKPITLNAGAAGVTGDVGRTAVLLRLHSGNFSFNGVAPNGNDLRFIGDDGRTVLNHQIDRYDASLGIALIWVDVPALRVGQPTTIWLYYGNKTAPAAGNGQLTFDPDYTLVYHFSEQGAPARDTTAYGNNARTALPAAEDVAIGRGARLEGGPLVIPAAPSLAVAEAGSFTFSAWIRPDKAGPGQVVYARRDGASALLAGLDNGIPFVQVNGTRAAGQAAIGTSGQRTHFALTAANGEVVLYVAGREVARVSAPLPALATDILIGADAEVPEAAKGRPATAAPARGNPFSGAIDEVRLSKVARRASAIQADALSQGADARLAAYGEDEQSAGVSYFGFIVKAMPVDAWVVVCILFGLLLVSWAIMIAKGTYILQIAGANAEFTRQYRAVAGETAGRLAELADAGSLAPAIQARSTLWTLYLIALTEVRGRHRHTGSKTLSAASLGAIRASLEAEVTREVTRLSSRMNWLSTTIEGAPYVGLFGTVIGIMLVFAVAAMAGAVDINSVAPGMAAALLCTAAGLAVAIPALFGYNWLAARADAVAADMTVFVDEFTARLAEESEDGVLSVVPSGPAARRA